jgi:hypothetical protein
MENKKGFRQFFYLVVLISTFIGPAIAAEKSCPDSAQKYWKHFRNAVLQQDMAEVTRLSRFPFEIGGTLDSSETKKVNPEEFTLLFATLLKTDPGLSPEPGTMESMTNKASNLPPSSCNGYGNQFRIGTWIFELTPGGWLFVKSFIED